MYQKRRWVSGALVGCILGVWWASAAAAEPPTHDHKQDAKVCYFDHIKYTNKGSYTVLGADLYYVNSAGTVSRYLSTGPSELNKETRAGGNFTVDLNNVIGSSNALGPLRDRQEVWPEIPIVFGETVSCHKDGHKLVYAKNSNRTIHFMSAGTTKNNNRCEYAENMENQCDSSVPPVAQ